MAKRKDAAFRLVIHEDAISRLDGDIKVKHLLERLADQIVPAAQSLAPKRTGAGAASIQSEIARVPGYEVRVGWLPEFFYMRFQDRGTVRMKAKQFLKKAARKQYKSVKSWEV